MSTPSDLSTTLKKRLLSGGAWVLGGRVVVAVAALTSNALLARLLSRQEFGAYGVAFSLVLFGALVVGSGGLGLAIVRFVAESVGQNRLGRARSLAGIAFVLGLLGASVLGIAYLLFGDFLGERLFHAPALASVTGLVAVWIAVMTLQNVLAEVFRGFNDMRLATAFNGLVTGLLLAGSLGVLWFVWGQATLATVLLLAAGSGLIGALLASWALRHKVASLPEGETGSSVGVREVVNVSWPLLMASLAFYVLIPGQADVWVLAAFRPEEEVGIYYGAARLVALLSMPLLIVNAVTPPLIAEMYARGERRELERTIQTIAALASIPAFLVLACFILFGGTILSLVYGDDFYREGATALAVLSTAQLATFWSGSCGMLLNMTGHQRAAMMFTTLGAITALTVALAMVNVFGMLGVALGSFAGLVLQNVTMVVYSRRVLGIRPNVGLPSRLVRGKLFR